jgi:AcrR family transcriptional regulator
MPTFATGASPPPGSGSASGTDAVDAADGLDGSLGVIGPRKRRGGRLSADQRRAQLLDAAVVEFAERGYQGTRTADIAARAGVSQPYVYALFPDKRSLFLACHAATTDRIRESIEKASVGSGERSVERTLDRAYRELLDAHPHQVLFQVQAHAAATADPVIRAPVRERFMELVELSERLYGVPRDLVLRHVARVMLGNVALALDLPPEYRPAV